MGNNKITIEPWQVYGDLTVREFHHSEKINGTWKHFWACDCICGNIKIAEKTNLWYGRTTSCGCLRIRKRADLTGQRFGRLIVVEEGMPRERKDRTGVKRFWKCKCDCGNMTEVSQELLVSGHTKSCGCLQMEGHPPNPNCITRKYKRLFRVWMGIRERCLRACGDDHKRNYQDAGVKLCDEWMDFMSFKEWAYANGYDDNAPFGKCTIDRINPSGNYEPSNCRWTDTKTQARNKRYHRKYNVFGEELLASEVSEKYGVKIVTFKARVDRYGFTPEEAVTLKPWERSTEKARERATKNKKAG